jgi:hypothetical protein
MIGGQGVRKRSLLSPTNDDLAGGDMLELWE